MMKKYRFLLLLALCLVTFCINAQTAKKGVSEELAAQRKACISNVRYDLSFNIPASQRDKVTGTAVVSFNLKNKEDVVLDFKGKINGDVLVGKKKRKVSTKNDHITVPAKFLKQGIVVLTFQFTSQNDALERNNDYIHANFATNDISSAFPCFDQPDIEAKYNTQLNVPEGWKGIICDESKPLPSRLYSFIAGNFQEMVSTREGYQIRALYRESDPAKVQQLEKVFDETATSLKWMEGYTGIKYPFKECGLIILPNYPLGSKEYMGYTLLSDQNIFLGNNPTKDEEQSRLEFIAHETSHLWFGSLVVLKNPEETWAKEVLGNFLASKMTRQQSSKADYDLNFIRTYQARAMAIDRTESTHPIAMPMENNCHTSMLKDQIFCNKVPVMTRMLEDIMEDKNIQNGLRNFLRDYSYKEATLDDLLTSLDKEAPAAGIRQFSEVWAQQKGMPLIHTTYKDGQLIISQTDPYGRGLCWRQKFQVYVIFNLGSSRTIHVDMQQPIMTFKLKGKPSFIIPNYDGRGYGQFTLDDDFVKQLPLRLITTRNDMNRYLLLETIHDHYLMGKVNPSYFGEIYRMMMKEKNPLIMSTAIDHMFKIAFDMTSTQRPTLELCMMDLLGENKTKDCRQTIIRKLAANMTSPEVRRQINTIWTKHNETTIFDEHDYMNMAYRLAMLQPECWKEILDTQRERLQTEDLKKEFDYVSRACNPDENKRADLFNSLLKSQNRQEETWALQTLDLLSADIYEPNNLDYITASLSSLKDIQKNSSANFPLEWVKTILAHHKSVIAKQAVENFLASNPDYPNDLKNNILEAAWTLLRQQPYVEKEKPVVVTKPKTTTKTAARKSTAKKKK
jgi:aminopeptidase N